MKNLMKLMIIISLLVFAGCVKNQPVPIVKDKTFCWEIILVNPYGYLYHNRCEKSDVVSGEVEGAKIRYRDDLQNKRREIKLKEKKELF